MVFAADVGDRITVEPSGDLSLTVTGPRAEGVPTGSENLVIRAARLLAERRGIPAAARIVLDKHLPHGAGLGGGSSDAAAALRALARMWDLAPLTAEEALPLGADLPVCLGAPTPALMSGIGEIVEPVPGLPEFWLVLVNPNVPLDTARVFSLHADLYGAEDYRDPWPWTPPDDLEDLQIWLLGERNALGKCVAELTDRVGEILSFFRPMDASLDCDMSGSGSTCWAMFATAAAAQAAADLARARFPGHWIRVTRVSG